MLRLRGCATDFLGSRKPSRSKLAEEDDISTSSNHTEPPLPAERLCLAQDWTFGQTADSWSRHHRCTRAASVIESKLQELRWPPCRNQFLRYLFAVAVHARMTGRFSKGCEM